MDKEILYKLYSNPQILNYLRFNPEWYKILYHEPDKYKDFEKEAKSNLKITTYDKIEDIKGQIGFIQSIIEYARK
jgi:hypothetical protein